MDSSFVSRASVLRFGVFELDRRAGELRRSGVLLHLPPQPVKILSLLASQPGQVVTREEIRRQIWGDETFVDFERGLNQCVSQIRTALGDDADTPRYIETLPRRGYRFIFPVTTASVGELPEREPATFARVPEVRAHAYKSVALAAALVALIVAAVLATNVASLRDRLLSRGSAPPTIHSIAVLPLKNLSADPEQEFFADGMTEELITTLGKISALRVISRTSVMHYKGTRKTLPEIARELNVDAIVEGTVERSGNRVRITANLLRATSEHHLWAQTYERGLGDVLSLQDEVAEAIASQIKIKLTPQEQVRLASARPVNPQAYEAYLRGRYLWNKRTREDIRNSIVHFNQALKIDSSYAPAYAGIADSYIQLQYYGPIPTAVSGPKAREAALRAVALDDSFADGHVALGEVVLNYDWDWSAAEKEFRRAIALNPNSVVAHHRYSGPLMFTGRLDEALTEMRTAQHLDPLVPIFDTNVGSVLFLQGKYDLAIQLWESTRELHPDFWVLRLWLGWGYLAKGRHDEALRELEIAVNLSKGNPSALAWLGYVYAISGKTAEAHEILAKLQQQEKQGYVPPYEIAVVYAGLGEKDQAFKYLEKAFQERDPELLYLNLKRFPLCRPLRPDPRFQELLRRMNFPQ